MGVPKVRLYVFKPEDKEIDLQEKTGKTLVGITESSEYMKIKKENKVRESIKQNNINRE